MIIFEKTKMEKIQVLHNSEEEMLETIEKLKKEGWEKNVGYPASLSKEQVTLLKEKFPSLMIHEGKEETAKWLSDFDSGKYIWFSEHERVIEE